MKDAAATASARDRASERGLAGALLATTVRALGEIGGDRDAILDAVDHFVVEPTPARYLAASGLIAEARRRTRLLRLRSGAAERSHARGVTAVERVLPRELTAILSDLAVDARAGQRLEALAGLVAAERELSSLVEGARQALRRQMAPAPTAAPALPARRRARYGAAGGSRR